MLIFQTEVSCFLQVPVNLAEVVWLVRRLYCSFINYSKYIEMKF